MKVSIRTKLLSAALTIIAVLTLASIAFFILHIFVVTSYKSISDNMINEYRLVENTEKLINNYNSYYRNSDTDILESKNLIAANKAEIEASQKTLDKTITNPDSVASYIGLKNTIANVEMEIDSGLADLVENNLENASLRYEAANSKSVFVNQNANELILNELKYVNTIQDRIAHYYKLSITLGITVFGLILVGCIIYFISFANKLVSPLQKLSIVAEKIAAGDMNVSIDNNLLELQDEIGSLSRSYHLMIDKLLENIEKLTTASTSLSSKNSELEQMNNFMVGRELKMVELKAEIEKLKSSPSPNSSPNVTPPAS